MLGTQAGVSELAEDRKWQEPGAQLGQKVGYSGAQVGKVETGERTPSRDFVEYCDRALPDAGGLFARIYELESGRGTMDLSNATWRKSSYSGGNGGNCVEVAALPDDSRAVRDSKDPEGPKLGSLPRCGGLSPLP